MGNNICCQQTRTNSSLQQPIHKHITFVQPVEIQLPKPISHQILTQPKAQSQIKKPQPSFELTPIPQLSFKVEKLLDQKKFFMQEQWKQSNPAVKRYGEDIYAGSLDSTGQIPHGFGKMYKKDKSLYIGKFIDGRANGKGVYIFPDGSYYQGDFKKNQAQSLDGFYCSQDFIYRGGFENNTFHGQGLQDGKDYAFQGEFVNGLRKKGTLRWNKGTCVYTGSFNKNKQFHGQGSLKQKQGLYEGNFVNGEKEGKGTFHFASGYRYEGNYRRGQRDGQGTFYRSNNQIHFQGNIKNGLPHGKGFTTNPEGKKVEITFVQGIENTLVPQ